LLVRDVAAEFDGRVKVSIEEYGNSEMAQRFGVQRYPVVFVDDVLLARPKDFGFGGPEDVSTGLYVPWLEPDNQKRFKDDVRRAVKRRLRGEAVAGLDVDDVRTESADADGPAQFPATTLVALDGSRISPASLAGKTVVVEMWATWCPPCRSTLAWLDTLQASREDLVVIAVAVDSPAEQVKQIVDGAHPRYRVVMGTPEVVQAFGSVAAVPKLFVFDGAGKRRQVLYGAPPDLHERIAAAIKTAGQ
jgi:thiol-disulfide isomerase/thioredoxin